MPVTYTWATDFHCLRSVLWYLPRRAPSAVLDLRNGALHYLLTRHRSGRDVVFHVRRRNVAHVSKKYALDRNVDRTDAYPISSL
jgi:hypothetical protein